MGYDFQIQVTKTRKVWNQDCQSNMMVSVAIITQRGSVKSLNDLKNLLDQWIEQVLRKYYGFK
jgi:hypothetical protein